MKTTQALTSKIQVTLALLIALLIMPISAQAYTTTIPATATIAEPGGSVPLTVTLDQVLPVDITIGYSISNITAAAGDYSVVGTMTVTAGNTVSSQLTIAATDDGDIELDETFTITLVTPAPDPAGGGAGETWVAGGNQTATVTIQDDDAFAVTIGPGTQSGAESGADLLYTVHLDKPVPESVSVAYSIAGITADAASSADYADDSPNPGTVTFTAGSQDAVITINPVEDGPIELDESFQITLGAITAATTTGSLGAASTSDGIIQDADEFVVTIGPASQSGPEDGADLVYTVHLDKPVFEAVQVAYSIAGAATSPTDYADDSPTPGTVTFAANAQDAVITINPVDDTVIEPDESFQITLGAITVATTTGSLGGASTADGIIEDSDEFVVTLTPATQTTSENGGNLTYNVNLDQSVYEPVSVSYAIAGSAVAGTDFNDITPVAGTVSFPAGTIINQITIDPLDDTTVENAKTFTITLTGVTTIDTTGSYTAPTTAQGEITSEDTYGIAIVAVTDSVLENSGTALSYTVTLSNPVEWAVNIPLNVQDVTTDSASDYSDNSPLVFPAGTLSQTIEITPTDDNIVEADETLTVTVDSPAPATSWDSAIPAPLGGTIENDDEYSISISPSAASTPEDSGAPIEFTVTLSNPVSWPLNVGFTLTPSANLTGADYSLDTASPLVFAANDLTKTIQVTPVSDVIVESDETFDIESITPTPATSWVGGSPAAVTGTIIDVAGGDVFDVLFNHTQEIKEGTPFAGNATISLNPANLGGNSGEDVAVSWAVQPGSAVVGSDYDNAMSGSCVLNQGAPSCAIDLSLINAVEDVAVETYKEDFTIEVAVDSGRATIDSASNKIELTIVDDDYIVTFNHDDGGDVVADLAASVGAPTPVMSGASQVVVDNDSSIPFNIVLGPSNAEFASYVPAWTGSASTPISGIEDVPGLTYTYPIGAALPTDTENEVLLDIYFSHLVKMTADSGTGGGNVTSTPASIDTPPIIDESDYTWQGGGGDVTVTANADAGSCIRDFSIDGTSLGLYTTDYTFNSISTDHEVDVLFGKNPIITVNLLPAGSVSTDPPGIQDVATWAIWETDSSFDVTGAVPITSGQLHGTTFPIPNCTTKFFKIVFSDVAGWATPEPIDVTLTPSSYEDVTYEGTYSALHYKLTILNDTGSGDGDVSVSPEGDFVDGTNYYLYSTGTIVNLNANPDGGFLFSAWLQDASGSTSAITMTMDSDKVVEAVFVLPCLDNDGDGFTSPSMTGGDCGGSVPLDCNDADSSIFPGANEICGDGVDQNCGYVQVTTVAADGTVTVSLDPAAAGEETCDNGDIDQDGDGFTPRQGDCLDSGSIVDSSGVTVYAADIHPGAYDDCETEDVDEDCYSFNSEAGWYYDISAGTKTTDGLWADGSTWDHSIGNRPCGSEITCVEPSENPMNTTIQPAFPLIMFLLDDSGSMDFEFMTPQSGGDYNGKNYLFDDPGPWINTRGGNTYKDARYSQSSRYLKQDMRRQWQSQWSGYNKIYYDHTAVYNPWERWQAVSINQRYDGATDLLASNWVDLEGRMHADKDTPRSDPMYEDVRTSMDDVFTTVLLYDDITALQRITVERDNDPERNSSTAADAVGLHPVGALGSVLDLEDRNQDGWRPRSWWAPRNREMDGCSIYYYPDDTADNSEWYGGSDGDWFDADGDGDDDSTNRYDSGNRNWWYNVDDVFDNGGTTDDDGGGNDNWFTYYRSGWHDSICPNRTPDILLDNSDPGFVQDDGSWSESGDDGWEWQRSTLYTSTIGATATWIPVIDTAGNFNAYAWSDSNDGRDEQADYTVYYDDDNNDVTPLLSHTFKVNQRSWYGKWTRGNQSTRNIDPLNPLDAIALNTGFHFDVQVSTTSDDFFYSATPAGVVAEFEIYNSHYYAWYDRDDDGVIDNAGDELYLVNMHKDASGNYVRDYYLFNDLNDNNNTDGNELEPAFIDVAAASAAGMASAHIIPEEIRALNSDDTFMTAEEERQNFADWYSFYRRRELTAKAALGKTIEDMEDVQVGLLTIQNRVKQPVLPIDLIDPTDNTYKDETETLLNKLYGVHSSGGTPLRQGAYHIGEYFDGSDSGATNFSSDAPWALVGDGGTCQKAFAILMTDGFWNGTLSNSVGDVDTPVGGVYRDESSVSNSLADVTMHFYNKDLMPTYEDHVPKKNYDTARYQHMTTYGVAFGVSGNFDPRFYPDCLPEKTYTDGYPERSKFQTSSGNVVYDSEGYPVVLDYGSDEVVTPVYRDEFGNVVTDGAGDTVSSPQDPGDYPTYPGYCPAWQGTSGNEDKIDDLYHASVNGRGAFLNAGNPQELITAMAKIREQIKAGVTTAASVKPSTPVLRTETVIYQPAFEKKQWAGNMFAYCLNDVGEQASCDDSDPDGSKIKWNANDQVEEESATWWNTGRKVITMDETGTGVPFTWTGISASMRGWLGNDANILNYLRGDRTKEEHLASDPTVINAGGYLRDRKTFFGDFVNANPVHFSNVLFAGANDGALHVFAGSDLDDGSGGTLAEGGELLYSYIPNLVYREYNFNTTSWTDKLHDYTQPAYNSDHHFFVDNEVTIKYIEDGKTYLVGGLRRGGKGYYMLNIWGTKTLDVEANAEDVVMWEYPQAPMDGLDNDGDGAVDESGEEYSVSSRETYTDPYMGYSYSQAYIVRLKYDNGSGTAASHWVVVFGNGYDSYNKVAALYILDAETGELVRRIIVDGPVRPRSAKECNGMSTPALLDEDLNGYVDRAYAGDLLGNMWNIDLSSETPSDWGVYHQKTTTDQTIWNSYCTAECDAAKTLCDIDAGGDAGLLGQCTVTRNDCTTECSANTNAPLFQARSETGFRQPITSKPSIQKPCTFRGKGYMVIFGTGRFIGTKDFDDIAPQTLYGIWDWSEAWEDSYTTGGFSNPVTSAKKTYLGTFAGLKTSTAIATCELNCVSECEGSCEAVCDDQELDRLERCEQEQDSCEVGCGSEPTCLAACAADRVTCDNDSSYLTSCKATCSSSDCSDMGSIPGKATLAASEATCAADYTTCMGVAGVDPDAQLACEDSFSTCSVSSSSYWGCSDFCALGDRELSNAPSIPGIQASRGKYITMLRQAQLWAGGIDLYDEDEKITFDEDGNEVDWVGKVKEVIYNPSDWKNYDNYVRVLTSNPANWFDFDDWEDSPSTYPEENATVGWYYDLTISGERQTTSLDLQGGVVLLNSIIPSSSPCESGGNSYTMGIDSCSGGATDSAFFDTTGDFVLDLDDFIDIGSPGNPILVSISGFLNQGLLAAPTHLATEDGGGVVINPNNTPTDDDGDDDDGDGGVEDGGPGGSSTGTAGPGFGMYFWREM